MYIDYCSLISTFVMLSLDRICFQSSSKIVSLRRSFFELHILETELLPSDVIKISFYRPPNFTYRSGQWIRVSCNVVGYTEYHSLTITSAPHEDFLSIHIKARGPWTWRLRNYFDPDMPRVNEEVMLDRNNNSSGGGGDGVSAAADAESTRAAKGEQQIQPRIRLQVPVLATKLLATREIAHILHANQY